MFHGDAQTDRHDDGKSLFAVLGTRLQTITPDAADEIRTRQLPDSARSVTVTANVVNEMWLTYMCMFHNYVYRNY
jgi:hypothetical protein